MNRFVLLLCFVTGSFLLQAQMPSGLGVNDKAPSFTAKDQNGNTFNLENELKKGPVVMIFYRGYWCPYCNKQLKALEDSLGQITAKGAKLVAITPEKPESITKTTSKTGAQYPILYDKGLKIMDAYRVSFAMDTGTITRYKKFGIDIETTNGVNGANLPVPAVYIIRQNGIIGWRFFDVNYTKRPTVKELLENL